MTDDWPVAISRREYYPIPESWIDQGRDARDGDHRLFAVSVAPQPVKRLFVRYMHPRSGQVLVVEQAAHPARPHHDDVGGLVPSMLESGRWSRSTIPRRNPDDVIRPAERHHLRHLWGDRVDAVPTDAEVERELRADGGPVFDFGGVFDVE